MAIIENDTVEHYGSWSVISDVSPG